MSKIVFSVDTAAGKAKVKDFARTFTEVSKQVGAAVRAIDDLGVHIDTFASTKTQKIDNIRIAMEGVAAASRKVSQSFRSDLKDAGTAANRTAANVDKIKKGMLDLDAKMGTLTRMERRMAALGGASKLTADQMRELNKSARDVDRDVGGAGRGLDRTFSGSLVSRMAGMVGAFVSIQTAISVIRGEMERVKSLNDAIAGSKITGEVARDEMLRQAMGDEVLDPGVSTRIKLRTRAMAGLHNIPPDTASRLVASGLSSIPGVTAMERFERTEEAIEAAYPVFRTLSPEDAMSNIGALGDVGSILNLPEGISDTDRYYAGLGYLAGAQVTSRSTDIKAVQQNLTKLMATVRSRGGSLALPRKLLAGLGQAGADVAARITTTGAIATVTQLQEYINENRPDLADLSLDEQFEMLLSDEFIPYNERRKLVDNLAVQFLDDASYQKKYLPALEQVLFDPDSPGRTQYRAAGALPSDPASLVAQGKAAVKPFNEGRLHAAGEVSRAIGNALDSVARIVPGVQISDQDRQKFNQFLAIASDAGFGDVGGIELQTLLAAGPALNAREALPLLRNLQTSMRGKLVLAKRPAPDFPISAQGGVTDMHIRQAGGGPSVSTMEQLLTTTELLISAIERMIEVDAAPEPSGRQE